MSFPSVRSPRFNVDSIDALNKTKEISNSRHSRADNHHADVILITLKNDFYDETEKLLGLINSYKLNAEIILLSEENFEEIKHNINKLHGDGKFGPQTQVIISMHSGINNDIHHLGSSEKEIIGTLDLLKLIRQYNANGPDSWNGLIHLSGCQMAYASEELGAENHAYLRNNGSTIFYGGHKELLSADGSDTLEEVIRLIGQNIESIRDNPDNKEIKPLDLFHHAACVSGETLTIFDNGISQRSRPLNPVVNNLQLEDEKIQAQIVRSLHSRLQHSSYKKVDAILEKLNKELLEFIWNDKTPLQRAALSARDAQKKMASLLKSGADINGSDEFGKTALHHAIISGNSQLAEFLISNGADLSILDDKGQKPIDLAVLVKNIAMITLLLKADYENNPQNSYSALTALRVIESRDQDIVNLFLKYGRINFSLHDSNGMNIFSTACFLYDEATINKMLAQGANPLQAGPNGVKPVVIAALQGKVEMLNILLSFPTPFWPDKAVEDELFNLARQTNNAALSVFLAEFKEKFQGNYQ